MPPSTEHIVTSYEDELTELARTISEMGGLVEKAIVNATEALIRSDSELALATIAADKKIDAMQTQVDDMAVSIIARRQPMAEDLVQETFLRAWRSLESLHNDKAAKAWLFTILRRENARQYERYRPELVDIDGQSIAETDDNEPDSKMDRQLLHNAINRLHSDYREPLLLQVIGGFSGKEIAEILGLNNNTVMTRLFRARGKLKVEFGLDKVEIED